MNHDETYDMPPMSDDNRRFLDFLHEVHASPQITSSREERDQFLRQLGISGTGEQTTQAAFPAHPEAASPAAVSAATAERPAARRLSPHRSFREHVAPLFALFSFGEIPAIQTAFAYAAVLLFVIGAGALMFRESPQPLVQRIAVHDTVQLRVMDNPVAQTLEPLLERARTATDPVPPSSSFGPGPQRDIRSREGLLAMLRKRVNAGNEQGALYYFQRGTSAYPEAGEFWSALAGYYSQKGDYATAGALYMKAAELHRQH